MAQLYTIELQEIEQLMRAVTDRIAVLHGAVHHFEEATRNVQQQHVLHNFRIEYDVHGRENGVILTSLQDIRVHLLTVYRSFDILTTQFHQMESDVARTADVLRAVREAHFADDDVQP
ncbi:uncharacterized protein [Linepithema humile]|uniref:uncharacterized protein n=1 Tax=Linepithema humile TaxID=83485 RepID=UPI00351F7E61